MRVQINRVFITMFATTNGLIKLEVGEKSLTGFSEVVSIEKETSPLNTPNVYIKTTLGFSHFLLNVDAFENKEEAIDNCLKRLDEKIAEDGKNISKMRKLKVELSKEVSDG